jgi:serine O-acetyltransferase
MKLIKLINAFFYSPILLLIFVLYYLSKNKQLIDADIARLNSYSSAGKAVLRLVILNKEFRNIMYYRLGTISILPKIFLRENPTLHIMTKEIGPGLIVVHGDSTYVNAKKIGNNFYIDQCATIGVIGTHAPVIGNNVRVATGAIVLGKITVGNNVNIGAGAVVVKNVPDNCTVVGNPARIVKMNGKRVEIEL